MKKFFRTSAVILGVAASAVFCACDSKKSFVDYSYHMGTSVTVVAADVQSDAYSHMLQQANQILAEAEASLSVNLPTSYISAFNAAAAGERVALDKISYEVLSAAKSAYVLTDGAYNPAVYYSVKAYGFYNGDYAKASFCLPHEDQIAAYATLSAAFADLSLSCEGDNYYAVKPAQTALVNGEIISLKLDLGGIGKGWCADRVDELYDGYGIEYGYFNFGSSSIVFKKYKNGNNYTLAARNPRGAGQTFFNLAVKNTRVSTSGDYEQYYFVKDGARVEEEEGATRLCHIINPATGKPINSGVASVTVAGGSAAENDALTTALSVMGKDGAINFVKTKLASKKVIMLIFEDGLGTVYTNCPEEVKLTCEEYAVKGIQ